MSTPKTGTLGGFGDQILGGAVEPGDLQTGPAGLFRQYRFHEGGGTTANSEAGGSPLTSSPITGTPNLPVFASSGYSFTSASMPVYTGGLFGESHASLVDGASSGEWATALATGGTIEFWFKLDQLPVIDWSNVNTIVYYGTDGSGALVTSSATTQGAVPGLSVLSIGDPSADFVTDFPAISAPPTYLKPFLHILTDVSTDESGTYVYRLVGPPGVVFGDVSDLAWHHIKLSWSNTKHFIHTYFDGAAVSDYGGVSMGVPSSGALLRVGGNAWGDPIGNGSAPLTTATAPANVVGSNPAGAVYTMKLQGGGATFSIENLAIYGQPTDLGSFSPVYVGATTSFSVRATTIVPQPVRVTQIQAEALVDEPAFGRLTQEVIEVVRTGSFAGRTTGLYAEVLRSLPVETFNVSATTSFNLSPSSTKSNTHVYTVSATTSFGISSTDTSRLGVQRSVSATTSLNFTATTRGYVPAVYSLSASTGINVAGSGGAVVHNPQPYFVTASSSINFTPAARIGLARVLQLAATTGFNLTASGYAPTTFHVSANTGFFVSGRGNGRTLSVFVSASTSFSLSQRSPNPYVFGPKFVSASTSLSLATPASLIANLNINVSAMSSMALSNLAREMKSGPVLVSATTNFNLTWKLAYTNPGPRYVAATTNLSLAATATYGRSAILNVSASTGVALSSVGSESAIFKVSGSSGFVLIGAGQQNRALLAAATTSLGLSNTPKTGNLKTASATGGLNFTVSAGLRLTGTEAESGIVFTDLAQAVVWIPWRRTGLTLPAGGNLPHS